MMKTPTKNDPICRILPLQGQDQQGHESETGELLSGVDPNAKKKKKKKITSRKEENHNRKDGDQRKKQKDGRKELKESVKMQKDGKTKQKVGRNKDGEKKNREINTNNVGKGQKGGEKKQGDDGQKERDSEEVENSQKDYENKQKNRGKLLKDVGKKPRGVKKEQIGGEKRQLMKTITGPLKRRARKENISRWRKLIKTQQTLPHRRNKVDLKTRIAIETLNVVHKSLVRTVSERLRCTSSFYTSFPPLETDPLDCGSSINFLTFPDVFINKRRNRPKPYVVPRDRVRLFSV